MKVFSLLFIFASLNAAFVDITKHGHEQYQDIFVNGKVVKKANYNHSDNDVRYQILKKVFDRFDRPFSLVDIGAAQGYYSFRAAHEYDCVCILIEGDNQYYPMQGRQLLDLCRANTELSNIIMLDSPHNMDLYQTLADCEHFDVVLALNILHWMGKDWTRMIELMVQMGSHVIIETPPPGESSDLRDQRQAIIDYLLAHNAEVIGEAPRHTSAELNSKFYLIVNEHATLRRKTCIMPLEKDPGVFAVHSTYTTKKFTKTTEKGEVVTDWVPGINLVTFARWNGVYPEFATLQGAVENVVDTTHNDWRPNNMVLQGAKIALIDYPSKELAGTGNTWNRDKQKGIEYMLLLRDPAIFETYFFDYLIHW